MPSDPTDQDLAREVAGPCVKGSQYGPCYFTETMCPPCKATAAIATLLVGPLSFVGLMAPHMARVLGLQLARAQLLGSGLLGALLMVLADWLGRNLMFPEQIPAGLLAALLGGGYLIWGLSRRR